MITKHQRLASLFDFDQLGLKYESFLCKTKTAAELQSLQRQNQK